MGRSVIAIGLDSAEPSLVEAWMEAGQLPHLARLRAEGAYGRLSSSMPHHKAEVPWTCFLTGCSAQRLGYWGPIAYDPARYLVRDILAYDLVDPAPFYELGDAFRVAVLDMPQTRICDGVNGLQVLGWGSHSPQHASQSRPAGLLDELTARHGRHPLFGADNIMQWRDDSADRFVEGLCAGIARRAAIAVDLVGRERWNLFLAMFGESHSAGHALWHLSQPHPIGRWPRASRTDPLLEVMRGLDAAVGEIAAAAPGDAAVVVFSAHGVESNNMDLPSNLFLPELLYRWSFPGRMALASPRACPSLAAPARMSSRNIWLLDAWNLRDERNPLKPWLRRTVPHHLYGRLRLDRLSGPGQKTPLVQHPPGADYLAWLPASWYQPLWPEMKAFALPSFSDGYVRLNLRGREAAGRVERSAYKEVADEIAGLLAELRDARTGRPVVRDLLRVRSGATADDPGLPDADLVVEWDPEVTTDAVESPRFGRIGPAPYFRTGGHSNRGFLIARGPGFAPGGRLPDGDPLDLAPTLLDMLGAPIPGHCEGRSLRAPGA